MNARHSTLDALEPFIGSFDVAFEPTPKIANEFGLAFIIPEDVIAEVNPTYRLRGKLFMTRKNVRLDVEATELVVDHLFRVKARGDFREVIAVEKDWLFVGGP